MTVLDSCVETMRRTRGRIEAQNFQPSPGFYAVYLTTGDSIGNVPSGAEGLIYVGTSKNLAQRDMDTHFTSGKSGFSTLRRSLGALHKEQLALRAEPRGPGASTTNTTNYRFDTAGEARLTAWMRLHLEVGFCEHDVDRHEVERGLIAYLRPPLNLTRWTNPSKRQIIALRAACRDEAAKARLR